MRRAFTLMELMVVVVIAAILVVSSMPDSDTANNEGVHQFSGKLEADLSYARSLSIADPSDPVIVKVNPDTNRYWLARASTPDTPIVNPSDKKQYVVQCGETATIKGSMKKIEIVATAFDGDQILKFNSMGTLDQRTKAMMRVKIGDATFDIELSPQSTRATVKPEVDATMEVGSGGRLEAADAVAEAGEPEEVAPATNANVNNNTNTNESGGLVGGLLGGLGL